MNELDIEKIRQTLGLTQIELAKKLGVDKRTVQNWEAGKTIPKSKHEILRSMIGDNNTPIQAAAPIIKSAVGSGNKVTNNEGGHGTTEKFLEEIAAQRKITETAQSQINTLLEHQARLITMLEKK